MDTNRCHRASRYALEAPRMAIAVPDDLQERGTEALYGCVWQVGVLPVNHRAGRCALEAPRMAIAVPDDLQERGTEALYGRAWQFGDLPANHRADGCALERCLEGFGSLDGHKSVPSREPICPGGP